MCLCGTQITIYQLQILLTSSYYVHKAHHLLHSSLYATMDMTKEMAKYIMEITVVLQKAGMILKTIVKKLLLPLFGIGRHITRLLVTLICEFSARSCLIE